MNDLKLTGIYDDEIEETVIPDNDEPKNNEITKSAALPATTAETDISEKTDGKADDNTSKHRILAGDFKSQKNTLYGLIASFGEFIGGVAIKTLTYPAYILAYLLQFIWKHTALFRDAVVRTAKEIFNFCFGSLFRTRRVLRRTNREIKNARKQGDTKTTAKLYGKLAKNAVFGKRGIAVTLFNYAAPIIALAFLMSVVGYATGTDYAIKLTVNGRFVGYIESEQVYTDAEKIMQERINYVGDDEIVRMTPSYSLEMLGDQQYITKYQLANRLLEMSETPIEYAYGFYIDNKFYGALVDNTPVVEELEDILASYAIGSEDEEVTFESEITYVPGLYLSDSIVSTDEIIELVNSKKRQASYYTVEEGDSEYAISEKLGITIEELEALNPEITEEDYVFRIGAKLVKTQEVPFLSVSISRTEVYDVDVPYDTEYTEDDTRYQGVETILQQGENGTNEVTAKVYYVNGEEIKRTVLSSVRTKDPVTEIIAQGTLPPQSSHYSDDTVDYDKKYIWPVDGGRLVEWGWWDGGYAGHRGVDIWAPHGTDVYAGASGVVTFAGWNSGGLGYAVMILHPDGYTTVYAHNSELFVYEGQQVTQGQCIAAIGETGRAYGPHCHFEVRLGSERLNPRYYLSGLPELY